MADKNKNAKNAETGIDNLNESLTSMGAKMQENKKTIGYVIAACIVVAMLVFGFIFFSTRSDQESAKRYSGIEAKVAQQAQKADPAAQDSIANALAIKELSALAKSDAGKAGGNLANIDLAGRYYTSGKYAEAVKALQAAEISEPVMKANADILLADCYVNLNKLPDALSALDNAVAGASANPEIAVRALLKKGTVLDSQKKYADALAVYQTILADYPQIAQRLSGSGYNVEAYVERENARLGK